MKHTLHFQTLAALATDVALPVGLTVDEVVIEVGRTTAHLKPLEMQLDQPATVTVRLNAQSLAAFLDKKAPGGLKDFTVKIQNGKLTFEATGRIIVELRVAATCTLRIESERLLYVDLESVSIKAPMAYNTVQQQIAKINPVLDLRELGESITMQSVEANDGVITLHGRADWPQSG